MKRQISFYGKLLAFTTLALAIFCTPLQAQNVNSLKIVSLQGEIRDTENDSTDKSGSYEDLVEGPKPRQLNDYLEPGDTYELLPGTKVELASADGKKIYLIEGRGILAIKQNGEVKFHGKILSPRSAKPLLNTATVAQKRDVNPGATAVSSLQIISFHGEMLDAGKATIDAQSMQLYDYVDPGTTFELGPGTKVELASADGKKVYVAEGWGILAYERNGRLTFNGKILTPRSAKPLLAGATVAEKANVSLGATVMRSEKQAPVKPASAKQVSVQIRQAGGRSKLMRLYSGYYALVVGCGDYQNGWPKLPNPVRDAKEMAKMLEGMGWQVTLLENPDHKVLQRALNNLITGPGRNKEQGIFLWFSGHGHTLAQADGSKLGYIVPVDAPNPNRDEVGFMERAISMRQIETVALRVRSKHLLMAFDSCFSGSLFNITRAVAPPFIEEKVAYPVREFITAGNENEEVPDKSMFKTVFVQGLVDGFADLNKDGYITGQELGAYLQENVVNYTRKAQHPQFGKINNPKLDKGDFVFVVKEP